ncbi:MAG: hypothetical protein AB7F40_03350 [Victivallaceae bacterium]
MKTANMSGILKKLIWPGYVLLLAVAATAAYYAFRSPAGGMSAETRQQIEADIKSRAELHRRRLAELETQFEQELRNELPADFQSVGQSASAAADRLSGYGSCMKLSYKLAKDRFTGGSEAESSIRDVMRETVIAGCVTARLRADGILDRHLQRIREADGLFRGSFAAVPEQITIPASDGRALSALGANLAEAEARTIDLSADTAWATAGAAIEAVMLRSTVRLIGSALSKAAARLAASAGSAAVSAAADGPLPIGDCVGAVIGVGGLSWTAYDIYQARKTMPDKLRRGIAEAVDAYRDRTSDEILQSGRSATAEYAAASEELERNLINLLGN